MSQAPRSLMNLLQKKKPYSAWKIKEYLSELVDQRISSARCKDLHLKK